VIDILCDARCFQDPNYALRGVGHHAATVYAWGKSHAGTLGLPSARWIAWCDPMLPQIHETYHSLFDTIVTSPGAPSISSGSVLLQPSPMTHAPEPLAGLLDRPGLLTTTLVHDFIPWDQPDRYLSDPRAMQQYVQCLQWLPAYDFFFSNSSATQCRLRDLIDAPIGRCRVTGVALRKSFLEMMHRTWVPTGSREEPYVLLVGGGDPRKNADLLVKAHGLGRAKGSLRSQLRIAGHYPQGEIDRLRKLYVESGGKASQLRIGQTLTDQELAQWYQQALATVCSSRAEGFSIPVTEAMACGSLVLASDIPAHCELVADNRCRFAPDDDQRLLGLLEQLEQQPAWREELRSGQRVVPQRYTAEQVGRRFWGEVVRQIQQRKNARPRARATGVLPRLAIQSPWPPDRSGVADYTRRTVDALRGRAIVDVYTDNANPARSPGVDQFLPISSWAYLSGRYDGVLSVVGNSHFHTKIIDLQRMHGGPCLIHDNRLAELYHWWKGEEYFRQMACRSLGRDVTLAESNQWVHEPSRLPGIFFDELLDSARPLIVHSRGIQRQVEKQYGVSARYLPFCCHRLLDPQRLQPEARIDAQQRLGLSRDSVHVMSFGLVAWVKAPKEMIEGIAAARRLGVKLELHLVGEAGGLHQKLKQHARQHGVERYIHFVDQWIDEAMYQDYLQAADLAIQLRTHFFGGLSGALLDTIAAGIPTVANEDLAEALESPGYVLRVNDEPKGSEVGEKLVEAVERGWHRQRLTDDRQRYITEHSFERYADQLLELLLGDHRCASRELPSERSEVALDDELATMLGPPTLTLESPVRRPLVLNESPRVFIDTTHTVVAGFRTGVQRVVRSIAREAFQNQPDGFQSVLPVILQGKSWIAASMEQGDPRLPGAGGSRPWREDVLGGLPPWYRASAHWLCDRVQHPKLRRWLLPLPGHQGVFKAAVKISERFERPVESEQCAMREGDLLLLPDAYWGFRDVWPAVAAARHKGVRTAVVIYDLIPHLHPEIFGDEGAEQFRKYLRLAASHADLLLAISETVAEQVREHLPSIAPRWDRSTPVVAFPLGAQFTSSEGRVRAEMTRRFDPQRPRSPYLMVGTIEMRKNHRYALEAMDRLWQRHPKAELAIVGQVGWRGKEFLELAHGHPEFGRRLHLFHDVSDQELAYCYRNARGVLFPSMAEGYGLPIVEGLWYGQAVFASDIPIHREVGGDQVQYCDTRDPGSLTELLEAWEHRWGDHRPTLQPSKIPTTWQQATEELFRRLAVAFDRSTKLARPQAA
jgi:glycosyltransferase involved in cell wall biosynthesis